LPTNLKQGDKLSQSIQITDSKLTIQDFEIEDTEVLECFKDVKPEDIENRFRLALRIGLIALKTIGTTERIDYIQKEFNKLDTKFNEVLQGTADQLSEKVNDIFGEKGTMPSIIEKTFGEEGKVNSLMENHLGDKGTFSQQLEKYFGKNGLIVKELFDPTIEGTPLNQLKKSLTEELQAIKKAIDIEEAQEEAREKSTQKGADFEDICEELLDDIVKNHKGDTFQRTTTIKGQITNSKKGDFIVDVTGKTEYRIVVETKDWESLTLPKINQEIDEALKNRGAKYGILVSKWNEAFPRGVGCFNYYNDDRIVCSLGSREDEILHKEILHTAYCWARANILRKSANCEKVNFELIDNNLNQIKSQLDLFNNIKSQCNNINTASKKIVEATDDIEAKIQQSLRNIHSEMQKGTEQEIEAK
jgi:hypothetical protein